MTSTFDTWRGSVGTWRRLWPDQRGAVLVEFAVISPVLLLMLTGIIVFGFALNQYATLWNAVGSSALEFAISGGASSTPASTAWNALTGGAPTLTTGGSCSSGLCLTLYVNGDACLSDAASLSAAEAADATCSAALGANAGNPAQAVATYPCSLTVMQYDFYPDCQLAAAVTELVP